MLATRNAGKLRELEPFFASHGWRALSLADVSVAERPEEDALEAHATFEENALAKARHFAALTGHVVVADDSGLVVDALDGRPGVHSKRWSGSSLEGVALDAENNRFLLAQMAVAAREGRTERTAAYVCAAACVWPGGELVRRAATEGEIVSAPRGGRGFGYDPFFLSSDLGVTFGEATREQKEAVSHRGRAFRALLSALADDLESFFVSPVDLGAHPG